IIADEELGWLFENSYPNTLDTTVNYRFINGKPDTFVITGDIPAMWLRDSCAQVWPYLSLINEDENLKNMIAGVINRHTKCILIDPYANAFNDGPAKSIWENDLTDMKPELHERKWELDSLCYTIRLAYGYWKTTGDISCFDENWQRAMKLVVTTFKEQQRKENRGPYTFQRVTAWQSDTVPLAGYGNPVKPVGLICSIFRPSDDAAVFPFLIPSNYFAVVSLNQLSEIFKTVIRDKTFANECGNLADEVKEALDIYAVYEHKDYGKILPYEIDGFENKLFMDDAGIPSLLSLPYLGCIDLNDPLYINTRKYILSEINPWFFKGNAGEGIGSPHTLLNNIWPLGIIMRALTSGDDTEIKNCLNILKTSHAETGFMHESFDKDNSEKFTRKWFAWANSLFGELIIRIFKERPYIFRKL
ncbi:glycoside hydrolase family 125 protein, partial [candidate division KSB1 bacterium]